MKTHTRTKLVSALTVTALLLSLAGCSSSDQKRERSNDSSETESSAESSAYSAPESSVWYPSGYEPSRTSSAESASGTSSGSSAVPQEWLDSGIFSQYYEAAYGRVKTMTLEAKIGQMLFAACPSENAEEIAFKNLLGGYVMFGDNFKNKTKQQVTDEITTYIYASDIPMCIAVDEEGGTVTRVSGKKLLSDHEFQSPRDLYNSGGMIAIQSDAQEKAQLLKDLFIDVNLAPVCDIAVNYGDFMYSRSLGQDAQTTSDFVTTVTEISQNKGVSVTLKHFPGYGSNSDTHTGIAVDYRDYSAFETNDFLPFQAGIDAGAHCVLVSHNIVNCMDSEHPASLSPAVIKILRESLGFTGIIMTDDLSMDAISLFTGGQTPAVAAVLAGNDMMIVGSDMIESSIASVKAAVEDGTISESIIDHAVTRILSWKYQKGLLR